MSQWIVLNLYFILSLHTCIVACLQNEWAKFDLLLKVSRNRFYFANSVYHNTQTTRTQPLLAFNKPKQCETIGTPAVWRHVITSLWLARLIDWLGFPIIFFLFMDIGHLAFAEWRVWCLVRGGFEAPIGEWRHKDSWCRSVCYSRWPYLLYDTVIVASCVVPNCSDMARKRSKFM